MVITKEVDLPEVSALSVTEVNLSTATLMSAAPYLGKHCENVNNEYMLCRNELNDPRKCLAVGKQVTACALQLFKNIKKNCLNEFNQYANCIDKSSGDYSLKYCRKTQAVFDKCMSDKLKINRPDFGYFCRGKIHTTSRAAPQAPPCPCVSKYQDATPSLPECMPRKPPRFGGRYHWVTE